MTSQLEQQIEARGFQRAETVSEEGLQDSLDWYRQSYHDIMPLRQDVLEGDLDNQSLRDNYVIFVKQF